MMTNHLSGWWSGVGAGGMKSGLFPGKLIEKSSTQVA